MLLFQDLGSEDNEKQFQQLSNDPDWQRLYAFIQHGLWHVTSCDGLKNIRSDGAIKPNIGGRYEKRFAPDTERSYGYNMGYISLFDFAGPTEKQVMSNWGKSHGVLSRTHCDQFLLQINREAISSLLIPSSQGWDFNTDTARGGLIPRVEVWCPVEITTDSITNVYRVPMGASLELIPDIISLGPMFHNKDHALPITRSTQRGG